MEYRICKNKFNKYKIQRLVYEDKREEDPHTILEWFLAIISLGFYQPKAYQWRDTYDQTIFMTENSALVRVKELIKSDRDRFELRHDSWECTNSIK